MSGTQLAKAQEAAYLGYHVFPCRHAPETLSNGEVRLAKTPLPLHGIKEASRSESQIEQWWAQWPDALVGVAAGKSGLIALDIDMKKGKNGYESLKARGLTIPATFHYDTPSGGRHYVYQSVPKLRLKQQTNYDGMEGVDRQSGNSYFIFYKGVPWESEIEPAPEWLLKEVAGSSSDNEGDPYTGPLKEWVAKLSNDMPSPFNQALLAEIANTKHVGNGEARDWTWQLARNHVTGESGTLLAYTQAYDTYWRTSNESDAKKEAEWERLMRGAIGKAEEAIKRGELFYAPTAIAWTPAEERTDGVPAVPTVAPQPEVSINLLTYDDLLNIPKPEWWVEGWFKQASLGVAAGEGGLGKSFLMLHLALCLTTGRPFFGKPVNQTKVLYVAAEGIEEFATRIQAACDYHGFPLATVADNMRFIEAGVDLTSMPSMDAFAHLLKEGAYGLVVLDTLTQVATVRDENSASEFGAVFKTAKRLRSLTPGSTVVTIHHANKSSGKYRGSSAIRDNIDTLVAVLPEGDSGGFKLSTQRDDGGKQRGAAPQEWSGFGLKSHMGTAVVVNNGGKPLDPLWLEVYDLLKDGTVMLSSEIKKELGIKPETAEERAYQRKMKRWYRQGALISDGSNRTLSYGIGGALPFEEPEEEDDPNLL